MADGRGNDSLGNIRWGIVEIYIGRILFKFLSNWIFVMVQPDERQEYDSDSPLIKPLRSYLCSFFITYVCILNTNVQEKAFEESQKYKEGKYILEKTRLLK